MKRVNSAHALIISITCAAGLMAQSPLPTWRTFPPASQRNNAAPPDQGGGNPDTPRAQYNDPPPPPAGDIPATLTLQSGTFITVHVSDWLSSDKNQAGDAFYASLAQPLVIDGIVVAPRGATVMGRIAEARKAGRVEGTSRLGLQLTNVTLIDGQQVSVQSQMIGRNGDTSVGMDAAAIGGSTAMGAAIGAAVGWGPGAAIGAGAGAVASTVGVLLTRGRPTEIYPETMLTFRLESPVSITTARTASAFRYADQSDYGQSQSAPQPQVAQQRPVGPPPGYGTGYPPPYPPAYPRYPYYAAPYYPYYGGGFSLYFGPGYYRGYYGFHGYHH